MVARLGAGVSDILAVVSVNVDTEGFPVLMLKDSFRHFFSPLIPYVSGINTYFLNLRTPFKSPPLVCARSEIHALSFT
jgi:hypothetical protein